MVLFTNKKIRPERIQDRFLYMIFSRFMIAHIIERFNMAKTSIDLIKEVRNDLMDAIYDIKIKIWFLEDDIKEIKTLIENCKNSRNGN